MTESSPQPAAEDEAPGQRQPPPTAHDLPKDAAHRLEELEHGLFTSDLSVNEFLLVKEAGFDPVGLVVTRGRQSGLGLEALPLVDRMKRVLVGQVHRLGAEGRGHRAWVDISRTSI